MNRHPVSAAFDQAADPPSTKFRDDLRAQLLADLAAPEAAVTFHPNPNHPPQEIIVTTDNSNSSSRPRGRRVLMGVAAAVIVIVGLTAVVLTRNDQDSDSGPADGATATVAGTVAATTTSSTTTTSPTTTVVPRDDATMAAALLLSPPKGAFGNLEAFEIMRSVEGCEDVVAVLDPAEAAASNSGTMYQWVLVFPTEEAAASAMAIVSSPAGQACDVTMDRLLASATPAGITAEIVDAPRPASQADSQVAWVVNVAKDGTTMFHKRTAWVQVDRSLIYIQYVGSLTDASFDAHETALSDAVELATAELAAG